MTADPSDEWFMDEARIQIDWLTRSFDYSWEFAENTAEFSGEPAHQVFARLVLHLAERFGGDRSGGERPE